MAAAVATVGAAEEEEEEKEAVAAAARRARGSTAGIAAAIGTEDTEGAMLPVVVVEAARRDKFNDRLFALTDGESVCESVRERLECELLTVEDCPCGWEGGGCCATWGAGNPRVRRDGFR